VDLIETPINPTHFPHIVTSITNSDNLPDVIEFIEQHIFKDYERVQLIIPYDKGDILSKLNEESNIISQSHNDLGITVEVELSAQQRTDLKAFIQ
jgi:GTP-binding protein HflX